MHAFLFTNSRARSGSRCYHILSFVLRRFVKPEVNLENSFNSGGLFNGTSDLTNLFVLIIQPIIASDRKVLGGNLLNSLSCSLGSPDTKKKVYSSTP